MSALLSPSVCRKESSSSGFAASHEDEAAHTEGNPDDRPKRGETHETEQGANKQGRSKNRARSPSQHEPPAAVDRISEFLDPNFELLDALHGVCAGSESGRNLFNHFNALLRRSTFGLRAEGDPQSPSR
jgi:hypothetical protein